jgi:hypothetical protein
VPGGRTLRLHPHTRQGSRNMTPSSTIQAGPRRAWPRRPGARYTRAASELQPSNWRRGAAARSEPPRRPSAPEGLKL